MTIYEKLAEARTRLNVKKSGRNNFAKYGYFELADFLPEINNLAKELGFICLVSFDAEKATMTIKDSMGEGEIIFTSPMSTAELKGCHAVQNLGAVQTYIRRYLYQTAFEIVEHDILDAQTGKPAKPEQGKPDRQFIDLKLALVDFEQAGLVKDWEPIRKMLDARDILGLQNAVNVLKKREERSKDENNK